MIWKNSPFIFTNGLTLKIQNNVWKYIKIEEMSQAEDVEIIGDENETDEDLSIELHKLKVML